MTIPSDGGYKVLNLSQHLQVQITINLSLYKW